MSYVDCWYDRKRDIMHVAERVNGKKILKEDKVQHTFYYEHPTGTHKSLFGQPCKKFTTTSHKKMQLKLLELAGTKNPPRIFESDIRAEFRYLSDNYMGVDAPELNVCFFDIETDFNPDRGFAPTDDPFSPVTAITVHIQDTLITLALAPITLSLDEAKEKVKDIENTFVFDDEATMLETFLDLTSDVDLFSGWNSEGYDIPYIVNRIKMILGYNATKRMCLWGQAPRPKEYTKFGKVFKTYDLVGKVHLDYLMLYQKHNTQQQHSYRLDFIGEIEVGENKTPYEGTLDSLYKNDFFRFIEYNRQDVLLLVKIDKKRKFIELANQIAHSNCVLLKTTVGSVSLVEQAIINEMHALGFVVPNRPDRKELEDDITVLDVLGGDDDDDDDDGRNPVVGAYVAKPKIGLHKQVACADINSLYPSTIRALNMSPETIVGQIRPDETVALIQERIASGVQKKDAWEGIFAIVEVTKMMERSNDILTVDFEDGRLCTYKACDLYDMIFDPASELCISANGTIFTTKVDGAIPQLLAKWYSERKIQQRTEKMFFSLSTDGIEIPDDLSELLSGGGE